MVRRLVLPILLSSILSYEMGTILLCCTQHHSSFLRALLSFPPSECSYDLWRGKNGQVLNDVTSNGKKMLLKSVMVTIFHEFPVHEIQALGIESTFISLSICKCDVFSPNTWPMTIIFKFKQKWGRNSNTTMCLTWSFQKNYKTCAFFISLEKA